MNIRTALIAAVAAIGAVSVVSASADTIDMRFVSTAHGSNVRLTTPSGTMTVFSGQLRQSLSNGTGAAAALNGEMITYCTDLTQHTSSSTQHFTVLPLGSAPVGSAMGADKARAIASIYDYAMGTQLTSSSTDDMACAFQLAVWEIVSDYSYSLGSSSLSITSGSFRATKSDGSALSSGVSNLLNQFFNYTNNSSFSPSGIVAITSPNYQDQLVPAPIPAPGSAVLAGLGLTLIGGRRRAKAK